MDGITISDLSSSNTIDISTAVYDSTTFIPVDARDVNDMTLTKSGAITLKGLVDRLEGDVADAIENQRTIITNWSKVLN